MELIKYIQTFSNPLLDLFFQLITMIGEDNFFVLVTAIIYWCIDKKLGYKLGFVTITSACVNFGIKDCLKVPRPIGEPGIRSLRIQTAEGYSFPSGHTQNTTTLWTFFMLHFKKGWFYFIGILVILLVGISRLYLGVHTPVDVSGGMLLGVVWVLLGSFIYEKAQRFKNKEPLILLTAIAIIGLFIFKEINYYKTVGALTGLLLGYLFEPRFVNFREKASLPVQVLKVSFGLGALYILKLVMKSLMPELLISGFLRYFILMVWITIIAPYIFQRFITNLE